MSKELNMHKNCNLELIKPIDSSKREMIKTLKDFAQRGGKIGLNDLGIVPTYKVYKKT